MAPGVKPVKKAQPRALLAGAEAKRRNICVDRVRSETRERADSARQFRTGSPRVRLKCASGRDCRRSGSGHGANCPETSTWRESALYSPGNATGRRRTRSRYSRRRSGGATGAHHRACRWDNSSGWVDSPPNGPQHRTDAPGWQGLKVPTYRVQ